MIEKFLNIFRIPDLRRRVLFTLGILAVYRLGAHITTPGVNVAALEKFLQQPGRLLAGAGGSVQRRQPAAADGVCAGHHAVHHGVDYLPAADGGV